MRRGELPAYATDLTRSNPDGSHPADKQSNLLDTGSIVFDLF